MTYARNHSDLLPEATRWMVIPTKLRGDRFVCTTHAAEARLIVGSTSNGKQTVPAPARRTSTGTTGTTPSAPDMLARILGLLPVHLQCQYNGYGLLPIKHCAHDCAANPASIRASNPAWWRKLFGYSASRTRRQRHLRQLRGAVSFPQFVVTSSGTGDRGGISVYPKTTFG